MFTAYVRPFVLPYYIYDSRKSGVADTSAGPDALYVPYTLWTDGEAGPGNGSTTTVIKFRTTPYSGAYSYHPTNPPAATSWVGAYFIIAETEVVTSKTNILGGSLIVSETISSGRFTQITLASPLPTKPTPNTSFFVVKHNETKNYALQNECYDLRNFIRDVTWTTSITSGYDTATITLNDSASILGKFYTELLGQNIEIYDIWGNCCWAGLVAGVTVNESGGTVNCVGYKKTFEWFRFERAYLPLDDAIGFHNGIADPPTAPDHGPTTTKVLLDVLKSNPYINKTADWGIDGWVQESLVVNGSGVITSATKYSDSQLLQTGHKGLGVLDFSDGSYKCSDVISFLENFGYYAQSHASLVPGVSRDTMYVQCWRDGYTKIQRVFKEPALLSPDYRISRKSLKNSYSDVEISSDMMDIASETYVIYTDQDGDQLVSASFFDYDLLRKYGVRSKVISNSVPTDLANIMAQNSRWDKSLLIGIGSVDLVGHVKGCGKILETGGQRAMPYRTGGGQGNNIPSYLVKAGSVIEFEENIGLASLYRNKNGLPGIFYVGATSFNSSTGVTAVTPATTLSVAELFATRQSDIRN